MPGIREFARKFNVQLFGVSLHQLPTLLPLALLTGSVIADVGFLATGSDPWAVLAFRLLGVGALCALVVAPIEFIDWLITPHSVAAYRRIRLNGVRNMMVIALFILSWMQRRGAPHHPTTSALICSFLALAVAGTMAWIGGVVMQRRRLAVERARPAVKDTAVADAVAVPVEQHI
jgi:uncharacterized membrane protein